MPKEKKSDRSDKCCPVFVFCAFESDGKSGKESNLTTKLVES